MLLQLTSLYQLPVLDLKSQSLPSAEEEKEEKKVDEVTTATADPTTVEMEQKVSAMESTNEQDLD